MKISIDKLKKEKKIYLEYSDSNFYENKIIDDLKTPIQISINIILLNEEHILLQGTIEGTFELTCDRCNSTFNKDNKININDIFEIEKEEIQKREIFIDPKIEEIILESFPMKILCDENCKGICLDCMANLNKETCKCNKVKTNK